MVKLRIISDKEDVTDVIKSAISAEIKRLEIGLNRSNSSIRYPGSTKCFRGNNK